MAAHRVNLLEIELVAGDVALAEALIGRTSQLHRLRIEPLLDRVFSEFSGPGRLDRIDRLELDLGTIAAADLDDDLPRKLEAALRAALARALAPRGRDAIVEPALELLTIFARTGNLPWWTERRDAAPADPIHAALTTLAQHAPQALQALLDDLAADPPALARLARHCDDPVFARLLDHRWPTAGHELLAAIRWLDASDVVRDAAAPHAVRRAVLVALAAPAIDTPAAALEPLARELAAALRRDLSTLRARLAAPLRDPPALARAWLAAHAPPHELAALRRESHDAPADMSSATSAPTPRPDSRAPRIPGGPAPSAGVTAASHHPAPTADVGPATGGDSPAPTTATRAQPRPHDPAQPATIDASPANLPDLEPPATRGDPPAHTPDPAQPAVASRPLAAPHDDRHAPPPDRSRDTHASDPAPPSDASLATAARPTHPAQHDTPPQPTDTSAQHDTPPQLTEAPAPHPAQDDATLSLPNPSARIASTDTPARVLATAEPLPPASVDRTAPTPLPPVEPPPPAPLARPTAAAPAAIPPSHHTRPRPHAVAAARRAARDQLDELYVDDAGLVLLWPFFTRFFDRRGLLDEHRQFLDLPAQHRAVAHLGHLATGDPDPPEFRLPLAKLLCGLAPDADDLRDGPLDPDAVDEGERLLAAVIEHAAVLRDMSSDGLRRTFLGRPGALLVRDGAWLLRVERRDYDVLLDRFPWSWSWLKLPWMPDPLQVEW